jgi:hypothetical protein
MSNINIPCFSAARETKYGMRLYESIRDPNLVSATLVSFSFSGEVFVGEEKNSNMNVRMFDLLSEAAQTADITLVIGQPIRPHTKIHTNLSRLSLSGVKVMLGFDLHAKVALFDFGDRKAWMVGSSNVTRGGVRDNAEINLVGYRAPEYEMVASSVDEIVTNASVF